MRNLKAGCTIVFVSLMVNQVITPSISRGSQVWLSNLSQCTPNRALVQESKKEHWRTIEYTADEVSGVLVSASPGAPDLTLAMGLKGWHAVYVGLWASETARVKLTSDPCFRRMEKRHSDARGQSIEEVFFKYADLTGQDLVIAGYSGPLDSQLSSLAYVRCEPLSKKQVEKIRRDRQRTEAQKRLIVTNDGNCVVYACKFLLGSPKCNSLVFPIGKTIVLGFVDRKDCFLAQLCADDHEGPALLPEYKRIAPAGAELWYAGCLKRQEGIGGKPLPGDQLVVTRWRPTAGGGRNRRGSVCKRASAGHGR